MYTVFETVTMGVDVRESDGPAGTATGAHDCDWSAEAEYLDSDADAPADGDEDADAISDGQGSTDAEPDDDEITLSDGKGDNVALGESRAQPLVLENE